MVATLAVVTPLVGQAGGLKAMPPVDTAFAKLVAGCYVLVPGPWQTGPALARIQRPPERHIAFEIRATPFPDVPVLTHDEREYPVIVDSLPGWGRGLFRSWRRDGTDGTILVGHPLAFGGFSMRLKLHGSDLEGTNTAFTDAIPPDGVSEVSAPVTAQRIRCSDRRDPSQQGV